MTMAYLRARNINVQRARVRHSMNRIDPGGVMRRTRQTISRRVYHVATPNSVWHMDGHMKLIRYSLHNFSSISCFVPSWFLIIV